VRVMAPCRGAVRTEEAVVRGVNCGGVVDGSPATWDSGSNVMSRHDCSAPHVRSRAGLKRP
jgi:hypothetical protein